jgi:hypothetical protein
LWDSKQIEYNETPDGGENQSNPSEEKAGVSTIIAKPGAQAYHARRSPQEHYRIADEIRDSSRETVGAFCLGARGCDGMVLFHILLLTSIPRCLSRKTLLIGRNHLVLATRTVELSVYAYGDSVDGGFP